MSYRSLLVHSTTATAARARLRLAASLRETFSRGARRARTSVPTRELTPFTSAMLPDAVVAHRLRDSGDAQARAQARVRRRRRAKRGLTRVDFAAPAGRADRRGDPARALRGPGDRRAAAAEDAHAAFEERARARGADAVRAARCSSCRISASSRRSASTSLDRVEGDRASRRARWPTRCRSSRARSKVVVMSISAPGDDAARETLADTGIAGWLARHDIDGDGPPRGGRRHRRRQPAAVARGGPRRRPHRDGRVQPAAAVRSACWAASRGSCCRR